MGKFRTLYIDMNSFFASVEQHENPVLRGRPGAITAVDSNSGACVACSYEAKAFGIKTGTPVWEAIRSLDRIIEWRGKPGTIRVDNGPEYISEKLMTWAEKQGVAILHIQPGQPQQNAYIERYNRTVRHEWLDQYIIESIEEAQDHATQWLWTYNNDRPSMGIGGITPAQKLRMAA